MTRGGHQTRAPYRFPLRRRSARLATPNPPQLGGRLAAAEAGHEAASGAWAAERASLQRERDAAVAGAAERGREGRAALRRARDAFGRLSRVLSSATSSLHSAAMHAGTLSTEEPGTDEDSLEAVRFALAELASSAQAACDTAQRGHAEAQAAFSGAVRDAAPSTPMSAAQH